MIVTPTDALLAAREHLRANEALLKPAPAAGLSADEVALIQLRTAQVKALSAWAAAHQEAAHAR